MRVIKKTFNHQLCTVHQEEMGVVSLGAYVELRKQAKAESDQDTDLVVTLRLFTDEGDPAGLTEYFAQFN